jgi:NAD(P)-dependent dehydrogenase (short-subunit alcohol dehydrogenase family)
MAPSPVREVIQAAVDGTTLAVPTDVSDPTQVAAMVEQTVARFGRLDAAFNNAGTKGAWGPVGDLSVEDFDATIGVNLRCVWLCFQALRPAAMFDTAAM